MTHRPRGLLAVAAATALVAGLLTAGTAPATAAGPAVVTRAGLAPALVAGRGADLGFQEQEAEKVDHNGTVLGPSRAIYTQAAEACGRSAVRLTAGQWVEFTLPASANAITVRYSIPDAPNGGGISSTLTVKAGTDANRTMALTSKYSWFYPFVNKPGSNPAHVYDEQRMLFDKTYPANTPIRLTMPTGATAGWTVIDVLDSHLVPAATARPAGSLSVADYGADPTGAASSWDAFTRAIADATAQAKTLYIPAGTYQVNNRLVVDNVRIVGAGSWRTVLRGTQGTPSSPTPDGSRHTGIGFYGKYAEAGGSSNVHLSGFAIIGDVAERIDSDQVNGIGGALSNSTIDGLFIQHTKVGIWVDGPMNNLQISNTVIVDQMADGVNFHRGVTNSSVRNSFIRNTHDDSLAMWADVTQNSGNTFAQNTIQTTTRANGIAIYGGSGITVQNNLVVDPSGQGSGIHLGARFNALAFAGTITVADNTVVRAGIHHPGYNIDIGAIWFMVENRSIDADIQVRGNHVLDSTHSAFMTWALPAVRTQYAVRGLVFSNNRVDGTGASVLSAQSAGSASFTNVDARNVGAVGVNNCGSAAKPPAATDFTFTPVSGNDGGWAASRGCAVDPRGTTPPPPSTWVQP